MATAKRAFGTKIYRETSPASGTYTVIGGVENITFPEIGNDFADSTDMESAGGIKTQIPTLGSLGDCSFDLLYDSADATQEQLTADAVAQTIRTYQIVGSDTGAVVWTFAAYVKSVSPAASKGDAFKCRVTLAPTGAVTRT